MDINLNSTSIPQPISNNHEFNEDSNDRLALPLHLQHLENALSIDCFARQVQSMVDTSSKSVNNETSVNVSKQQLKTVKTRLYNLSKVKKTKKWIKDVLLDKSDSSESDSEAQMKAKDTSKLHGDSVHDLIKFENLKRKLKQPKVTKSTKDESGIKKLVKFNSSDLLGTNFDFKTQSSSKSIFSEEGSHDISSLPVSTSIKSKKGKVASANNVKAAGGKKRAILPRATPSPAPTIASLATVKENGSFEKAIIPEVPAKISSTTVKEPELLPMVPSTSTLTTNSFIDDTHIKIEPPSVAISSSSVDLNSTCLLSNSKQLNSFLSLDSVDSLKFKDRLLDEIPYDMTLPDEILQTESTFNQCDTLVSRSIVNEAMVYNTNLPDEIFDTEESNNSVISQTLSSPSPSMSLYNPTSTVKINSAIARPVTAPSTPTGLTSSQSGKRKSKPLQPRSNLSKGDLPLSSSTSSLATASPDTTDAIKRKKVWMFIVKNEILKNYMQLSSTKVSNCSTRKSLAETCKQNHLRLVIKWHQMSPSKDINTTLREEMFQYWSSESSNMSLE